jgi:hypothetical protein
MKDFQFITLCMAAVFAVAGCDKREPEAEKPEAAQESKASIVTLSDKKLPLKSRSKLSVSAALTPR